MLRRLIEASHVRTMGKPGSNWSVSLKENYLLQAVWQDERRGERAVDQTSVRFAYKKEQEWRYDTAWTVWPVGGRPWLTVIGSDLCSPMSEPSNILLYFALSADSMYWFYISGTTGIETTRLLTSVTPSKSDRENSRLCWLSNPCELLETNHMLPKFSLVMLRQT